ncbi:WD40 repeat-containing protein [Dictyostelium discoideum AX4]|uniref:WD40 repeat-containing protein n=1 Tax=Dictyostelium discoideum TaxID=44689 RepID=Q55C95_DICDI|nr:WD40 repeat-containing protein [Dictyostelium discoideum AX4]EAL72723.1 WD40 repeat-containing protein [Dictyostelium discoideum AX4]|eukprot:XP_646586.1 WD40 repeat-containing protein [Dictyostelium discoideum AX4]
MEFDEIIKFVKLKFENNVYLITIPILLLVVTVSFIISSFKKPTTTVTATSSSPPTSSLSNKKNKKKNPSPTLQSTVTTSNTNTTKSNQQKQHIDTPIPSPPPPTTTVNNTESSSPNPISISQQPQLTIQEHKLFFKVFRGGDVIDCIKFSEDGKYLSFCGTERLIRMYLFDSLINSKVPQSFNLQLPFDNATCISWGNKTLYATLNESQKLVSFNILDQKSLQTGKSYEDGFSVNLEIKSRIKSICSSSQSPYILTCSGDDTILKIFNLKGQIIQTINNGQIKNYMAAMTQCGRFFAIASFSSEVKIYECIKKKDGTVNECKRVMSLTGYKTCIYSIDFSKDGLKIITSSKDGSIRLWNLNVNYKLEVDPECTYSITSEIGVIEIISISPDCTLFAGVNQTTNVIGFFNLSNGNLIDSIHLGNNHAKVNSIAWSPDSKYLISGGNDKLLYIWSNPKKL